MPQHATICTTFHLVYPSTDSPLGPVKGAVQQRALKMIHFISEDGKVFTADCIMILLAFFMVEGTQI